MVRGGVASASSPLFLPGARVSDQMIYEAVSVSLGGLCFLLFVLGVSVGSK